MRPALTLIELIFTMVIIALVFTVIPKMIFVSNKAMQLQVKEDALFDVATLMGEVSQVAWDGQTIATHGKILKNSEIPCQDGKPKNGWIGQRSCSDVEPDNTPDNTCDDIDDFTQQTCHENATGGRSDYNLSVSETMDENKTYKQLVVEVNATGGKTGALKSTFVYRSYNIGWAYVARKHVP